MDIDDADDNCCIGWTVAMTVDDELFENPGNLLGITNDDDDDCGGGTDDKDDDEYLCGVPSVWLTVDVLLYLFLCVLPVLCCCCCERLYPVTIDMIDMIVISIHIEE